MDSHQIIAKFLLSVFTGTFGFTLALIFKLIYNKCSWVYTRYFTRAGKMERLWKKDVNTIHEIVDSNPHFIAGSPALYIAQQHLPGNSYCGDRSDCAVVALSLFFNKLWDDVYMELAEYGKSLGVIMNSHDSIAGYMKSNGCKPVYVNKTFLTYGIETVKGDDYDITLQDKPLNVFGLLQDPLFQTGKFILSYADHLAFMEDGKIKSGNETYDFSLELDEVWTDTNTADAILKEKCKRNIKHRK